MKRTGNKTLCLSTMALTIGVGLTLLSSMAHADSGVTWGMRALRIQDQIDNTATFPNTMWVGTHNSFNAFRWDTAYAVDPNQMLKPSDQLESGARELTFDVYWWSATGDLNGNMLLCHGQCSGLEKTFRDGIDQIRNFLDSNNSQTVIMLKLEATSGSVNNKWSKVSNQLIDAIGGRIYKPSHHGLSTGCQTLNPAQITKQRILDKGKNVIVLNTPEPNKGCAPDGDWNQYVFTGFKFTDGTNAFKFDSPKTPEETLTMEQTNGSSHMSRVHDGGTWYSVADGNDGNELQQSKIPLYMLNGLNVFELFNFNGDNSLSTRPYVHPQDLVWSWRTGEPTNGAGENCAVSGTDDHFADVSCAEIHPFACRNQTTGQWKLTTSAGPYDSGDYACWQSFGLGWLYSVPVNPRDNHNLSVVRGAKTVWVNYQDISMEGQWVANSVPRGIYTTVSSVGGGGGNVFDDIQEMKVDLYRRTFRRVTNVTIRSGSRVDRVSATLSDGTVFSHGGSGGSDHSLTLASDEWINGYSRCYKSYNGSDRIFYLKFTTNKNRSIAGGKTTGTCSSGTFTDKRLFGFIGRAGENLDAVGFYFRSE